MPKMTLIGRLSDGLPLAASMADATDAYADELSNYDRDAKKLFRSLAAAAAAGDGGRAGAAGGVAVTPNQFVTVGAGPAFAFHYLVDGGVVFLTLAEKAYPNRYAAGRVGVLGGGGAGAGRCFCVLGRWRRGCEGGEPMASSVPCATARSVAGLRVACTGLVGVLWTRRRRGGGAASWLWPAGSDAQSTYASSSEVGHRRPFTVVGTWGQRW